MERAKDEEREGCKTQGP